MAVIRFSLVVGAAMDHASVTVEDTHYESALRKAVDIAFERFNVDTELESSLWLALDHEVLIGTLEDAHYDADLPF